MAAAPIVADLIEADATVGIAWGRTLSAMVDHLPSLASPEVVQIAGGAQSPYGDGAADLVRRLGERFDVTTHLLHAPLFVSEPATAAAMRTDTAIAATLERYGRLTTAVLGVGAWSPGLTNVVPGLTASEVAELGMAGVVAESCGMFFTLEGKEVSGGIRKRAIGIGLNELRSVVHRIGIAGGSSKAVALGATLVAELLTHLVTDRAAAEYLVSGQA